MVVGGGVYGGRRWCVWWEVVCMVGGGVYGGRWCVWWEVVCMVGGGVYGRRWLRPRSYNYEECEHINVPPHCFPRPSGFHTEFFVGEGKKRSHKDTHANT